MGKVFLINKKFVEGNIDEILYPIDEFVLLYLVENKTHLYTLQCCRQNPFIETRRVHTKSFVSLPCSLYSLEILLIVL